MIDAILIALAVTCALSTLIILSLALTAPPEPEQTPFTQATIDKVKR